MKSKTASLVFLFAIVFAGCSAGSPSGTLPHGPFSGQIAYISGFGWPGGSGGPSPTIQPTPLVMYDQQFIDPVESSYLLALQLTPPVQGVPVSWSSSNDAVAPLQKQEPFTISIPGDPAPQAPANEIFVQIGTAYGTSQITASAGSPVNKSVSLTAYHFHSMAFGCGFRYWPAFAFDPDRASLMQQSSNWLAADLYETAPSNALGPLDPCLNSPLASPPGTSETWHVPYGGVILPAVSLQAFVAITASQWRNAGSQFTPSIPCVLLLKTKEGRIVKALLPIGPYEASTSGGEFSY